MSKSHHTGATIKVALEMYIKHKSFRKAALHSIASKSSIQRWWNAVGRVNDRFKRQRVKRSRKRMYCSCQLLIESIVLTSGYVTLTEIRGKLACSLARVPSESTIARILKQLKFKRKRVSTHVTYTKPDVLREKIRTFQDTIGDIPLDEIISIDETGFGTHANVFHKYTRSKQEEKFEVPRRHSRSCVLAVTTMGVLRPECFAVKRGAFNTDSFVEFLDTMLKDTPLQFKYVVMDNISFHHSKRVHAIIERHGRVAIYTPPYSPRFNPIENVFSVVKRMFRKEYMRTRDIDQSIMHALHTYGVQVNDLWATFEHCIHCPA